MCCQAHITCDHQRSEEETNTERNSDIRKYTLFYDRCCIHRTSCSLNSLDCSHTARAQDMNSSEILWNICLQTPYLRCATSDLDCVQCCEHIIHEHKRIPHDICGQCLVTSQCSPQNDNKHGSTASVAWEFPPHQRRNSNQIFDFTGFPKINTCAIITVKVDVRRMHVNIGTFTSRRPMNPAITFKTKSTETMMDLSGDCWEICQKKYTTTNRL